MNGGAGGAGSGSGGAPPGPGRTLTPPPPSGPSGRASDKIERVARAYDADIWPLFASRFAALARGRVTVRPGARVVELGCATGLSTLELARAFDAGSTVTAYDESPAALALARPRFDGATRPGARGAWTGARIQAGAASPTSLPLEDATADVAVANLALGDAPDPAAVVREAARVLAPGGQLVLAAPLRGTWAEFIDVYRDVLGEQGKRENLAGLTRYVASLPDGDTAAKWMEAAGLERVDVAVERWEILFKSPREFFFAPLIELGPLSRWKQIAGRGDEMQDIFFFTKEALDVYFDRTVLPMTVVAGALSGWKPARQP